jgi:hypothetical protein
MYDSLTTMELTALQNMLFRAVEEAYWVITVEDGDDGWFERYQPMHRELGHLFIEAGEELLVRLGEVVKTA